LRFPIQTGAVERPKREHLIATNTTTRVRPSVG
jgi:hypothetical protein